MAEGARLESVYTFARIEGSNPSLTATFNSNNTLQYLKKIEFKEFSGGLLLIRSYPFHCNLSSCGG